MAEKENDLDGLFRSKLKDIEVDPSASSWSKIHSALQAPVHTPAYKPSLIQRYWMLAAIAVVVLTASWVSYQAFLTGQALEKASKAVLPPAESRKMDAVSQTDTSIAQEIRKPIGSTAPLQTTPSMVYTAIDTLKKVVLADGTVATLHQNAVLTLDKNFPEIRSVSLQGQVLFEVKPAVQAFEVNARQAKIHLHEGAFVLTTSPQTKLFVKSGPVRLSLGKTEVVVNAGEKTFVDKGDISKVTPILSANYLSWQTGKLVFDNTQLDQVVSDIESYYGVAIFLDNAALKNCRFTGVFEKPSLDEVLLVLSASFNLKYNRKANAYVLQGDGCK